MAQRSNELPASDVSRPTAIMIEGLGRALHADRGPWTIELELEDGVLRSVRRHHGRLKPDDIEELAAT